MLFKRKHVLCTNCGFLCWRYAPPDEVGPSSIAECPPYWRTRIQTSKDLGPSQDPETGEIVTINCIRRQWIFAPHIKSSELDYIDVNTLTKPRKCPYYINYQPGFRPEEHKELKREAETRITIRKATLLGAIIGSCAAIIAQLLYVLLTQS